MTSLEVRRKNHVLAGHVDAALRINRLFGRERAEALLQREGLSPDVIARVLSNSGKVRQRR